MIQKATGIILAGGKSSRMGFDKGLMEINGKNSIEKVVEALEPITERIIIISNNDAYKYLGLPVYKDIVKGKGPIGGIYTGLTYSETEINLVVACDMPLVNEELLQHILNEADYFEIALPTTKEKLHPLCAYYTKHIAKHLKNLLLNDILKMQEAIQFFHYKKIPLNTSSESLMNINTLEELKQIQNERMYAY